MRFKWLGVVVAAGSTAWASTDLVVTATGIQTGQIVRVDSTAVVLRMPVGEISIPRAEIVEVRVPQPAEVETGINALGNRQFREAINALQPIVERYGGLEIDWVEEAMLRLGEAQVGARAFADARRTLDRFRTAYPNSRFAVTLVPKYARLAVAQGKCAEALPMVSKQIEELIYRKAITMEEELAVAESLIVWADCQREAGNLDDALDGYLKVVALFNASPPLTSEARMKAAETFETKKNWRRAKGLWRDLIEAGGDQQVVDTARNRLAALEKAHPE
ncbi:MAG: tetratricopeptide repeat protein [Verrucomicrobiae bacterium]|nr:tetratricopeptide repeat protein [Verrucomicrobiae bacterium]